MKDDNFKKHNGNTLKEAEHIILVDLKGDHSLERKLLTDPTYLKLKNPLLYSTGTAGLNWVGGYIVNAKTPIMVAFAERTPPKNKPFDWGAQESDGTPIKATIKISATSQIGKTINLPGGRKHKQKIGDILELYGRRVMATARAIEKTDPRKYASPAEYATILSRNTVKGLSSEWAKAMQKEKDWDNCIIEVEVNATVKDKEREFPWAGETEAKRQKAEDIKDKKPPFVAKR